MSRGTPLTLEKLSGKRKKTDRGLFFFQPDSEPPDPDDFDSLDSYHLAWDRWKNRKSSYPSFEGRKVTCKSSPRLGIGTIVKDNGSTAKVLFPHCPSEEYAWVYHKDRLELVPELLGEGEEAIADSKDSKDDDPAPKRCNHSWERKQDKKRVLISVCSICGETKACDVDELKRFVEILQARHLKNQDKLLTVGLPEYERKRLYESDREILKAIEANQRNIDKMEGKNIVKKRFSRKSAKQKKTAKKDSSRAPKTGRHLFLKPCTVKGKTYQQYWFQWQEKRENFKSANRTKYVSMKALPKVKDLLDQSAPTEEILKVLGVRS